VASTAGKWMADIKIKSSVKRIFYNNRTPHTVHNRYDARISVMKLTVQVYHIIKALESVGHYLVLLLLTRTHTRNYTRTHARKEAPKHTLAQGHSLHSLVWIRCINLCL